MDSVFVSVLAIVVALQHDGACFYLASILVTRSVLSPRSAAEPAAAAPANDQAAGLGLDTLLSVAILQNRCLKATYNNGEVVLQPGLLYREHDALFLLAVAVLRDGKPPREPKLGTFRVSGLTGLCLLEDMFEPAPLHQSWAAKPSWQIVTALVRTPSQP